MKFTVCHKIYVFKCHFILQIKDFIKITIVLYVHDSSLGANCTQLYFQKNLLLEFKTIYFFVSKMLFVNSSSITLLFRYFSRDPISLPRVCLKYLLKKKKVKKLRICVTENSFIKKLGRTTHSDQLQKKKEKNENNFK